MNRWVDGCINRSAAHVMTARLHLLLYLTVNIGNQDEDKEDRERTHSRLKAEKTNKRE